MRTHTEQSPHQCTQCGEGFELQDDLQKHQQNECDEMMNQQEANEHQHGKDRISGQSSNASTDPKTCHLCHNTFFLFQYVLKKHLIVFQKGRSIFMCHLCLNGFAFLSALKKHQSNKRGCPSSEIINKRELWSNENLVGGKWTHEETKALISVWSNKQILQDLLRNVKAAKGPWRQKFLEAVPIKDKGLEVQPQTNTMKPKQ
ncbi:unnamed protein product [Coregonus sp. 'balchen']|nr:unnamed protein product [Coregonus sp. 'balchen']